MISNGDLAGFGNGLPPPWIHDAAGAEAWALYQVARLNPFMPATVTDCLGLLETLVAGVAAATQACKKLARLWNMIATATDGDFASAAQCVTWMPAHGAVHTIGSALKSNEEPITALDWRANRLADALAKAAANGQRVQPSATKFVERAANLLEFAAARAGMVTHSANNYKEQHVNPDGTVRTTTRRDSCAQETSTSRKRKLPEESGATKHSRASELFALPANSVHDQPGLDFVGAGHACRALARTRASRAEVHQHRQEVRDAQAVARWIASLNLQPSTQLPARERLDAVRMRCVERWKSSTPA